MFRGLTIFYEMFDPGLTLTFLIFMLYTLLYILFPMNYNEHTVGLTIWHIFVVADLLV